MSLHGISPTCLAETEQARKQSEGFFKFASRQRNTRKPLEGNAISAGRVYVDGRQQRIENVFDAAYLAYYAHTMAASLTAATFWNAITNFAGYRMMSVRKDAPFPDESEWRKAAPLETRR